MAAKTREDYEEKVQGPGRFEGEPPWTPYFYEKILEGWGEPHYVEEDEPMANLDNAEIEYTTINLMPGDWEIFPELNPNCGVDNPLGLQKVRVFESSIGFIHAELV